MSDVSEVRYIRALLRLFKRHYSPDFDLGTCTGLIRPGGTVVEGTAGNTGIGLAHMCLGLGYKCVIYMPDSQSQVSTCSSLLRTERFTSSLVRSRGATNESFLREL